MRLPFIRQEADVLFQQDNARPHMAAAMQRALRDAQQQPWPARFPDLLQIEHKLDMMKWGHSFSRACHNHCRSVTMGERCLGQSIAGWHLATFMTICMREYMPALPLERGGDTLCIDVTVWAPLTETCISFCLNLSSYTPTMINYLSHKFSIQWTCPCRCCIFFSSSVYQ